MDKIQAGKYVELAYEIFVTDENGETSVFRFTKEQPDCFVFGMDPGMIEGFSRNLADLEQGATFDFALDPADAFGEKDPNMVMELPRETFVVNGEFDSEKVFVGAVIPMQTQDGYRLDGTVEAMTDTTVTIDFNHQLAGERVHYVGEVLLVRDATPEELAPKHHHCGCGCDHEHGCDGCEGCC
ncbi:MAG: FKBP-type peptidyl-prolyl cis-trans isomerase [Muribaculaceae bacterium]|nr:FKBP-type peptidyl-prolyl cis-trans isomerase [Muribaculaceae bacterium]